MIVKLIIVNGMKKNGLILSLRPLYQTTDRFCIKEFEDTLFNIDLILFNWRDTY